MNPTLKIAACVIDIDATITNDRKKPQMGPDYILNNAIFDVIAQFMCKRGWEPETAKNALSAHVKTNAYWDYPDFLRALNLPEEETWRHIVRWHDEHLIAYPDAVSMVKQLHAAGMPLFIVSNNPLSGCLLKLQRAGLAGRDRSKYFRGVFGSNVCMGQKHGRAFWKGCLDRIGLPPCRLAVIGDNPKEDCAMPRSLGVKTVFLVDRNRQARVERTPEAFFVNTLESVPEILFRPSEWSNVAREEVGTTL